MGQDNNETAYEKIKLKRRKRTPQEKKRLRYEKDHHTLSEYPHAFRLGWPRKKAGINRKYRRKVKQQVKELLLEPKDNLSEESNIKTKEYFKRSIIRVRLRKWGIVTLREKVNHTLKKRLEHIAWNYFKQPYNSERDKDRFKEFLETIMIARSPNIVKLALLFEKILLPTAVCEKRSYIRQRVWLNAFFQDLPELKNKLLYWISSVKESL